MLCMSVSHIGVTIMFMSLICASFYNRFPFGYRVVYECCCCCFFLFVASFLLVWFINEVTVRSDGRPKSVRSYIIMPIFVLDKFDIHESSAEKKTYTHTDRATTTTTAASTKSQVSTLTHSYDHSPSSSPGHSHYIAQDDGITLWLRIGVFYLAHRCR